MNKGQAQAALAIIKEIRQEKGFNALAEIAAKRGDKVSAQLATNGTFRVWGIAQALGAVLKRPYATCYGDEDLTLIEASARRALK